MWNQEAIRDQRIQVLTVLQDANAADVSARVSGVADVTKYIQGTQGSWKAADDWEPARATSSGGDSRVETQSEATASAHEFVTWARRTGARLTGRATLVVANILIKHTTNTHEMEGVDFCTSPSQFMTCQTRTVTLLSCLREPRVGEPSLHRDDARVAVGVLWASGKEYRQTCP